MKPNTHSFLIGGALPPAGVCCAVCFHVLRTAERRRSARSERSIFGEKGLRQAAASLLTESGSGFVILYDAHENIFRDGAAARGKVIFIMVIIKVTIKAIKTLMVLFIVNDGRLSAAVSDRLLLESRFFERVFNWTH